MIAMDFVCAHCCGVTCLLAALLPVLVNVLLLTSVGPMRCAQLTLTFSRPSHVGDSALLTCAWPSEELLEALQIRQAEDGTMCYDYDCFNSKSYSVFDSKVISWLESPAFYIYINKTELAQFIGYVCILDTSMDSYASGSVPLLLPGKYDTSIHFT